MKPSPACINHAGTSYIADCALAGLAALTMLTSAGLTSSHLRVFRPQSGLTQICSAD